MKLNLDMLLISPTIYLGSMLIQIQPLIYSKQNKMSELLNQFNI